jgi:hypothetical protein
MEHERIAWDSGLRFHAMPYAIDQVEVQPEEVHSYERGAIPPVVHNHGPRPQFVMDCDAPGWTEGVSAHPDSERRCDIGFAESGMEHVGGFDEYLRSPPSAALRD